MPGAATHAWCRIVSVRARLAHAQAHVHLQTCLAAHLPAPPCTNALGHMLLYAFARTLRYASTGRPLADTHTRGPARSLQRPHAQSLAHTP
eukprot:6203212-Pleurochrysis_carterae.AAC.1